MTALRAGFTASSRGPRSRPRGWKSCGFESRRPADCVPAPELAFHRIPVVAAIIYPRRSRERRGAGALTIPIDRGYFFAPSPRPEPARFRSRQSRFKTTVFLSRLEDFAGMNEVAGGTSGSTAALDGRSRVPRGALLEIEAIAHL